MAPRRAFHGRADGLIAHTWAMTEMSVAEAERKRDRFQRLARESGSLTCASIAADIDQAIAEANALREVTKLAVVDLGFGAIRSVPVHGRINCGAPVPLAAPEGRNDYPQRPCDTENG